MAVNAFITFFDKADGESIQKGNEKWIEIQGWDWEIEAETSWTKGGGASVGKPNPGKMDWEHSFDTSSTVIMGYICNGKGFPKVQLQMRRTTGGGRPESSYFTMTMEGAFITKVSNSGTGEGDVMQRVEMVFKTVKIATSRKTTAPASSARSRPSTGTSRRAPHPHRPEPAEMTSANRMRVGVQLPEVEVRRTIRARPRRGPSASTGRAGSADDRVHRRLIARRGLALVPAPRRV